jgi:hypothetical protein
VEAIAVEGVGRNVGENVLCTRIYLDINDDGHSFIAIIILNSSIVSSPPQCSVNLHPISISILAVLVHDPGSWITQICALLEMVWRCMWSSDLEAVLNPADIGHTGRRSS